MEKGQSRRYAKKSVKPYLGYVALAAIELQLDWIVLRGCLRAKVALTPVPSPSPFFTAMQQFLVRKDSKEVTNIKLRVSQQGPLPPAKRRKFDAEYRDEVARHFATHGVCPQPWPHHLPSLFCPRMDLHKVEVRCYLPPKNHHCGLEPAWCPIGPRIRKAWPIVHHGGRHTLEGFARHAKTRRMRGLRDNQTGSSRDCE